MEEKEERKKKEVNKLKQEMSRVFGVVTYDDKQRAKTTADHYTNHGNCSS